MNVIPRIHYYLSFCLLLAVAPQMTRLPLWLTAVVIVSTIMYLPQFSHYIKVLPKLFRVFFLALGLYGIHLSHVVFWGPEGGVSFLILCAVFKLFESFSYRHYFISAILNFFIVATAFLFSQDLMLSIYTLMAMTFFIITLLVLHQPDSVSFKKAVKKSLVLVGQTIPLMVILFLFFPRFPPLWTLHLSQGTGKTGMSDSMSPGDLAHLSQSSELAFRVEFFQNPPPREKMYWRGLTFSYFDGVKWTAQGPYNQTTPWSARQGQNIADILIPEWIGVPLSDPPLEYHLMMEPTDNKWLFTLDVPHSFTENVEPTRDFRLEMSEPIYKKTDVYVSSFLTADKDRDAPPTELLEQNLALPKTGNEKARLFAQSMKLQSKNSEEYIARVLTWYRQDQFFYTLNPPTLSKDRIDNFLFQTKKGFCEHYASSFAFLMRAAGIPARVVVGYQGGEKSPLDNYWMILQSDAHAWVEVWLPQKGWVRYDPTQAVAPERIQKGASSLLNQPGYSSDVQALQMRYQNSALIKSLRNFVDYVNFKWNKDIVGFDNQKQSSLMELLIGGADWLRQAAIMLGLFVLVSMIFFIYTLRGQPNYQDPLDLAFIRFSRLLAESLSIVYVSTESPEQLLKKIPTVENEYHRKLINQYIALSYQIKNDSDKHDRKKLARQLFYRSIYLRVKMFAGLGSLFRKV